jgi:hypothetical protein
MQDWHSLDSCVKSCSLQLLSVPQPEITSMRTLRSLRTLPPPPPPVPPPVPPLPDPPEPPEHPGDVACVKFVFQQLCQTGQGCLSRFRAPFAHHSLLKLVWKPVSHEHEFIAILFELPCGVPLIEVIEDVLHGGVWRHRSLRCGRHRSLRCGDFVAVNHRVHEAHVADSKNKVFVVFDAYCRLFFPSIVLTLNEIPVQHRLGHPWVLKRRQRGSKAAGGMEKVNAREVEKKSEFQSWGFRSVL